ncbi:class I SAM-dependent methyltransferase [Kineosporia babensis]|uniref:Methyltransferase domain-containing protein n=1 Tax=Kineosporia babensis TaxID=499548 RepID=A0A9X1SUJ8_9ACTN|nr:methyltransferase domain-containing protein [Kineosporia babensis]
MPAEQSVDEVAGSGSDGAQPDLRDDRKSASGNGVEPKLAVGKVAQAGSAAEPSAELGQAESQPGKPQPVEPKLTVGKAAEVSASAAPEAERRTTAGSKEAQPVTKGAAADKASNDVPKKKAAAAPEGPRPGAKGAQGAGYARDRFAVMVGARVLRKEKLPYSNALEVGAGATFGFSLGLLQSGVVNRLWISDLATSALAAARRRSEQFGLRIQGDELADPELLPFPDGKFDLVVAHALLHRRMDPANTLTEMLRVLKPGGRFVITGESTRAKDWASPGFARAQGSVGRVGMSRAGKARTRLPERLRTLTGAPDAPPAVPDQLEALALEAGAREVKVKPEELLATVLPYPGADPGPMVIRSRERLSQVDRKLSQVLPASAFPTVGITGLR